jgi:hypothetical protein
MLYKSKWPSPTRRYRLLGPNLVRHPSTSSPLQALCLLSTRSLERGCDFSRYDKRTSWMAHTETKQSVHECQIETVFWSILEFCHCLLVFTPSLSPCFRSSTDIFCHSMEGRESECFCVGHTDGSGLITLVVSGRRFAGVSEGWEEWLDSVGEV